MVEKVTNVLKEGRLCFESLSGKYEEKMKEGVSTGIIKRGRELTLRVEMSSNSSQSMSSWMKRRASSYFSFFFSRSPSGLGRYWGSTCTRVFLKCSSKLVSILFERYSHLLGASQHCLQNVDTDCRWWVGVGVRGGRGRHGGRLRGAGGLVVRQVH